MTQLAQRNTELGRRLHAHLAVQLESAQRLLDQVLAEGRAIRAREVEAVLVHLAEVQAEMERRGSLERERTILLTHAGSELGIPAHAVTLEALCTLLGAEEASQARRASAHLRGLLEEVGRQHQLNRALMRQELAFLDHLTRLIGGGEDTTGGYQRHGGVSAGRVDFPAPATTRAAALRAFDLQA